MKRILILGIGNAQVDAFRYLKECGDYEIHGVSYVNSGRGREFCDKFEVIDIKNFEEIAAYCKRNAIDVIYSVGSDLAMPTVGFVSNKLSIPAFVTAEVARVCNRKDLLREKLKHSGYSVPFHVLENMSSPTCDLEFPVIVKPVDSQGQRGISVVQEQSQWQAALELAVGNSHIGAAIVEKIVGGYEVSVNAFLVEGRVEFQFFSERVAWGGFDGGIIHKHIPFKSADLDLIEAISSLVCESCQILGIHSGPVYFQIKIESGRPYVIEIAPRLDGCHMWKLIQLSTGVNLLKATFDYLCLDEPSLFFKPKGSGKPLTLEFISLPPNSVFKKPVLPENLIYSEFYYTDGDIVQLQNGKLEKCGYFIYEEMV